MNREGHNKTKFFIGPEVEKTPAADKKTLFVVGKQKLETILELANKYKTPHVFMGANHSFELDQLDSNGNWDHNSYWNKTITALLDKGYWVTLDYQAHQHESVLKMLNPGIWQSRIFVPLLGIRIPKIETSNHNLTVKIDDADFRATNPGVWCMHFSEVTDSNRFTDWNEYSNDVVLTDFDIYGIVETAKHVVEDTLEAAATVAKEVIKEVATDVVKAVNEGAAAIGVTIDPGPDGWTGPLTIDAETKEPVASEMNPHDIGLDPESPSMLKPEVAEVLSKSDTTPVVSVADAYAEGAKEDPLGKTESKKPKAKK